MAGQRVILGILVFFFQCHPHLSFSAIERPQITASIPQPIPFLFPNKFHCMNVLIFFFTKWKPSLLPSIFVTASQSFSVSDRDQNERNIGLHIQDTFSRLRVSCWATQLVSSNNSSLHKDEKVEDLLQFKGDCRDLKFLRKPLRRRVHEDWCKKTLKKIGITLDMQLNFWLIIWTDPLNSLRFAYC